MRCGLMLFGLALAVEGTIKQFDPKGWMNWLVTNPIAYMPEPIVKTAREFRELSPSTLRLLGLGELLAGMSVIWLSTRSREAHQQISRKAP